MAVRYDEGGAGAGAGGDAAQPNEYTFTGDDTEVTFFPTTPGPIEAGQDHSGGELRYQGPEGDFTFYGSQIGRLDSPLGTLLTVSLRGGPPDAGRLTFTIALPRVTGVTGDHPASFDSVGIKTATLGFINRPGPQETYEVLPLEGEAKEVMLPI